MVVTKGRPRIRHSRQHQSEGGKGKVGEMAFEVSSNERPTPGKVC